jgi:hypothetical protein
MTTLRRLFGSTHVVLLISSVLCACGDTDSASTEEEPPNPQEMAAAMEAIASDQPISNSTTPRLSAEELGNRLPPTALGIAQTDAQAISSGPAGTAPTSASARYVDEDASRMIEIGIIDSGAIEGTKLAIAGWATTSFNRRTANGFERTSTFEGLPALEGEEGTGDALRSRFQVAAGDYVVQLAGQNISLSQLKEVAAHLDLSGLGR